MLRIRAALNIVVVLALMLVVGCGHSTQGNVGNLPIYPAPRVEAEWIRSGEPIDIEGELWYPQDMIDILLDSEVYLIGEYQGVQIFVDKVDVRPFDRIYTKFSRNKFRFFKRKRTDD